MAQARLNGRLLVDAWVGLNEALPGSAATAFMGNKLEWDQEYAAYDLEIRKKYGDQHIAIITELGLARMYRYPADPVGDVGWLYPGDPVSEAQYTKSLDGYNKHMMEDEFVLGAALFQVGPAGVWETFRHLETENEGRPLRIMDWLAELGN